MGFLVQENWIKQIYYSLNNEEAKRKMREKFNRISFLQVGDLVYIKKGGFGASGSDESFGVITDEALTNGKPDSAIKVKKWDGTVWGLNPESMDIFKSSKSEIKTYLTNLATEKGFIKGVKVKSLDGEIFDFEVLDFWNIDSYRIKFELEFNISGTGGHLDGKVIFRRGKWATIINEVKISRKDAERKLNDTFKSENIIYKITN